MAYVYYEYEEMALKFIQYKLQSRIFSRVFYGLHNNNKKYLRGLLLFRTKKQNGVKKSRKSKPGEESPVCLAVYSSQINPYIVNVF
jgi:hypothetical protein